MDSLDSEPTFEELTQIDRAARAKAILEDPLVVGALSAIKTAIYQEFQQLPVGSTRELEHLHGLNWSAQQFEKAFVMHINNGVVSAKMVEAKERTKSIMQRAKEKIYGTH